MVSAGCVPPNGVASGKSPPAAVQADPLELMQLARLFARLIIVELGITEPAGVLAPGEDPVLILTRLLTVENAFVSPIRFVLLVPIDSAPGVPKVALINGASAKTEATVVTSLMLMNDAEERLEHGPRAAISAIALLVPEPAFPPVATMYTRSFAVWQADKL
jgi:hypothetical protein